MGEMRINCTLLVIVILASVTTNFVNANSEDSGSIKQDKVPLKKNVGHDRLMEKIDPVKKGEASSLTKTDPSEDKSKVTGIPGKDVQKKLKSGGDNDKMNVNENTGKDVQKEDNVSKSDPKKEPNEREIVRDKCDSFSNSCTDDDKMLVACLRVPGNDSPDLSLLIQNKGKGPLAVKISAPNKVQLEKSLIELQHKEDAEVKVSITGVENGHIIVLNAGHGNCNLDFKNQFEGRKQVGHKTSSTQMELSKRSPYWFLGALLVVLGLILAGINLWRRYLSRKGQTYQRLDMELPVSQNSKVEPGGNEEGWDDSWGDSWDDEEAPKTPSFPITPSNSSKGMASRKFNKDSWKD